jgi:hypothetical protein
MLLKEQIEKRDPPSIFRVKSASPAKFPNIRFNGKPPANLMSMRPSSVRRGNQTQLGSIVEDQTVLHGIDMQIDAFGRIVSAKTGRRIPVINHR